MRDYLVERVLNVATHINDTHDTIRATAKEFGYSKSTIHTDVSKRLQAIDPVLYEETKKILEENFAEKHIRGGESTRKKYTEEECE